MCSRLRPQALSRELLFCEDVRSETLCFTFPYNPFNNVVTGSQQESASIEEAKTSVTRLVSHLFL